MKPPKDPLRYKCLSGPLNGFVLKLPASLDQVAIVVDYEGGEQRSWTYHRQFDTRGRRLPVLICQDG